MDLWDISLSISETIPLPNKTFIALSSIVVEEILEIQRWKYPGHIFDNKEIQVLSRKFNPDKIIRLRNIWDGETIEEINKYVLEHEMSFIYRPYTSNPYRFEYYLFCLNKRPEKISSANIVNLIPKIERLLFLDIGRARYIHQNENVKFINGRDESLNKFMKSLK